MAKQKAEEQLERLSQQVSPKDPGNPPLQLWQPALSGDIDIVIHRDGSWSHEGVQIKRSALVRLFASILRREADGEYYLVTPVEKWRIRVESLPLQIVDFEMENPGTEDQSLLVQTNVDRRYAVGKDYPLYLAEDVDGPGQGIPAIALDHGLAALFSRAAWYRLADACETREGQPGVLSGGLFFPVTA